MQLALVSEADDDAGWRRDRLTTVELLLREMRRGKRVSPILGVMGVINLLFKIDWLHCADKGITADFLGNLFEYIVMQKKVPGATISDRCTALGKIAEQWYDEHNVQDRLKIFQRSAWRSEKIKTRPPSLKGNAASSRALVSFANVICTSLLSPKVPEESAMISASKHLLNCYRALSDANKAFGHDAMYNSSKSFAQQYLALFVHFGQRVEWRVMPKMHMFLELCSQRTEPSKFWCYRDEDFGGSVARQSRMKGRWRHLGAFAKRALDMFKMKNPAPRLVRKTILKHDRR